MERLTLLCRAGWRRRVICNDFEQKIVLEAYRSLISDVGWAPRGWESQADLPFMDHVRITDLAAVMRRDGEGVSLTPMRWSFPPARPGAGPVFNFRSEGRRFSLESRCLAPVSAFFEFTAPSEPGQKRKDRWRFERADGNWMAVAGLWRPGTGNQPATFTLLTGEPGPDVAEKHSRQIVVLEPHAWRPWLEGGADEAALLTPSPAGTFKVERG